MYRQAPRGRGNNEARNLMKMQYSSLVTFQKISWSAGLVGGRDEEPTVGGKGWNGGRSWENGRMEDGCQIVPSTA